MFSQRQIFAIDELDPVLSV